jgi:hypothetical protein
MKISTRNFHNTLQQIPRTLLEILYQKDSILTDSQVKFVRIWTMMSFESNSISISIAYVEWRIIEK